MLNKQQLESFGREPRDQICLRKGPGSVLCGEWGQREGGARVAWTRVVVVDTETQGTYHRCLEARMELNQIRGGSERLPPQVLARVMK